GRRPRFGHEPRKIHRGACCTHSIFLGGVGWSSAATNEKARQVGAARKMRERHMRLMGFWAPLFGAAIIAGAAPALADAPAVTGDTDKAREWAEKASQRFDAGDYRGAVEAMQQAERHYRAPTFLQVRAQALAKLGRLVEARDVYRTIAEWDLPENAAPVW